MDTSQVPEDLRPWLMLWFELMFESPAEIDGHYLPYEEVTKRFTGDLVSQSIGLGVNGAYNRLVSLRVKVLICRSLQFSISQSSLIRWTSDPTKRPQNG
jgi:hypothetical protein